MAFETKIAELEETGVVVLDNVYSPKDIEAFKAQFDAGWAEVITSCFYLSSPSFHALADDNNKNTITFPKGERLLGLAAVAQAALPRFNRAVVFPGSRPLPWQTSVRVPGHTGQR